MRTWDAIISCGLEAGVPVGEWNMRMEAGGIVSHFKSELERLYGERLVKVILYGSCARGEQMEDSDVDVVVVLRDEPHPGTEIDRMAHLLVRFNLDYGVLISVLPTSVTRWEGAVGPFWRGVREEGVPL